jgi:hypothetical protein
LPSCCSEPTITGIYEISKNFSFKILDYGAFRNADDKIITSSPMFFLPLAMCPVVGAPEREILERQQRRDVAVSYQPNVSAGAAVTTIRSASSHVSFAAKGHTASSSVSTFGMEIAFVDETRHRF